MKQEIQITLVSTGIILLGGLIWWALSHQASPNTSPLRIGTLGAAIDYAPLYVARNKGWIEEVAKKYGMSVEYTEFQSLPPINEGFASNSVDIVFAADAPAIIGRAAGVDTKVVYPSASIAQEVILHKDSPIQNFKDLKGKKIAMTAGTSAHYVFVKSLESNGLSTDDVEIIDMTPPNAKAAFETNQVDGWAIWPPFPEQEIVAGLGRPMKAEGLYTQVFGIVRGGFEKEQPELADEFGAAYKQAQEWVRNNGEEARSIVAQEIDLPLEVVELAWPKVNFDYLIGEPEIKDMQEKADFLFNIGLIKRKVNVADELIGK